jgi:hypothetical protein
VNDVAPARTPVTVSRLTRLLPLAILVSALALFASELMTTFEFTPPGAEPLLEQDASERHGNALMVIAAFAVGALALAVFTASKPAAIAVAVAGAVALLLFLLIDLPDANAIGTLNEDRFIDAEAVPREGFYMELFGALALAISGVALATLTPDQLAALRPPGRTATSEARARSRADADAKAAAANNGAPESREARSKTG